MAEKSQSLFPGAAIGTLAGILGGNALASGENASPLGNAATGLTSGVVGSIMARDQKLNHGIQDLSVKELAQFGAVGAVVGSLNILGSRSTGFGLAANSQSSIGAGVLGAIGGALLTTHRINKGHLFTNTTKNQKKTPHTH